MKTKSRQLVLPASEVFSRKDCEYAAKLVLRVEDSNLAVRLQSYVSNSPLWPKLVGRAAPRFLGRFIITNFLIPIACEFVRAQRAGRKPDTRRLASIWRLYAAKCSETERGSEVPDASTSELRAWIPENQRAARWRRVTCLGCRKKFRVRVDSILTRCYGCRFPGMRGGKRQKTASQTRINIE